MKKQNWNTMTEILIRNHGNTFLIEWKLEYDSRKIWLSLKIYGSLLVK